MKYDGAQTDRNNPATRRLAELAGIESSDIVLYPPRQRTQEPGKSRSPWTSFAV